MRSGHVRSPPTLNRDGAIKQPVLAGVALCLLVRGGSVGRCRCCSKLRCVSGRSPTGRRAGVVALESFFHGRLPRKSQTVQEHRKVVSVFSRVREMKRSGSD